ncbi:hypothetical protein LCGC14_0873180 [marine sediment metagenome]|uniref:Uncharacterized protein n=1 Tax=marine sediment metagenome TaxID=412755 RepID=A0A0F9P410_9ZZZZ
MKNLETIHSLKTELSNEWNKPKVSNLRKDGEGKIIDTRTPRDLKKIKSLQNQINELK